MKKTMRMIARILLVIFVLWGMAVAKCEVLTMVYGDVFESRCLGFGDPGETITKFKVISWSPSTVKVYAVFDNMLGSHIYFEKRNGVWHSDGGWVRWSDYGGNADEDILPYIRRK